MILPKRFFQFANLVCLLKSKDAKLESTVKTALLFKKKSILILAYFEFDRC